MTQRNDGYTAQDIQVLEGLEAVRRRPGMYIGSTDARGLHHLVYEIVDNSIDEAMAGYCDRVDITINPNGSVRVSDQSSATIHRADIGTTASPSPTSARHVCGDARAKWTWVKSHPSSTG